MLLSNGLVDKVFKQYEINISDQEDSTTESFGRISLFHAKCGLIELTGQNVLTKDTVTILEQSCDWDRSQKGIDIVQFRKLVRKFEECTFKNDQALVLENVYTAIDTNKKGWIDKGDFLKVIPCAYYLFISFLIFSSTAHAQSCSNSSIKPR